jgi:Phage Tail Collar Domain
MPMWQDDPTTVPVRWYWADPGANVFPAANAFCSANWDGEADDNVVGEQYPRVRGYSKGGNVQGYTGRHYCGPLEAWQFGGVHGVTPPITTDPTGYSSCCGPLAQADAVGVAPGLIDRTWWTTPFGVEAGLVSTQAGGGSQLELLGVSPGAISDQAGGGSQLELLGVSPGAISTGAQGGGYSQVTSLVGVCVGPLGDQEGDVPYVGEYRTMANPTPPTGWLRCDGSAVSQTTYAALYAILGTTWGPATGGNFTLPSSLGQFDRDSNSTTTGAGASGGAASVLLGAGQYGAAPHVHPQPPGSTGFFAQTAGGFGVIGSGPVDAGSYTDTGTNADPGATVPVPTVPPYRVFGYKFIYSGV